MEALEFYDHGARFQYGKSLNNIISTVAILTGSATVSQGESKLIFTVQQFLGGAEALEFDMKGDKYLEMEYVDFEDIIFFSSNKEYILFQGPEILAHKSWPSKVSCVKLGAELKLAICYEDGTIVSCGLDAANGNLVNSFQGNPDAEPEHMPVTWGSRSKNYKRSVKERASNYVAEGGPTIAWAADGDHFVINTLTNEARILLVFSKTCQLLYKSEPDMFPGIELPVAIEPESALIGCVLSETGSDQELIIVEKNLEILYSIQLEDGAKVQKMQWSNCSEVLAVWQKSESKAWLDLYMKSSNKFYLKQRLPLSKAEELLNFKFAFSIENLYIIQLIFTNYLFQYSFLKKLIKSGSFGGGVNLTCEINGKEMELYSYGNGTLPLKSSQPHTTKSSNDCISTVVFDSFRSKFAVIDVAYKVTIYKHTEAVYSVIAEFLLDKNDIVLPLTYYRYFFDPDGNFCAIRMGNLNDNISSDIVYYYSESNYMFLKKEICDAKILKGQCVINRTNNEEEKVEKFTLLPSHNGLITDHVVFKFNSEYSLTRYCVGSVHVNNTSLGGLFTSIHFTDRHILLTCHREDLDPTHDYLLALELNEPTLQQLILGSASIFEIAYSRPIEKGAVILNDAPKTSMVVLLLPRGNTEFIYMRNMSLKQLNQVLTAKDFEGAYNLIKFESLGLNLLVDLDPHFFKTNLSEIVVYLHEVSALYKFLIELTDSSSLTAEDKKVFNPQHMKNKRYEVCNMVIQLILGFEKPVEYLSELAVAGLCCQPEGFNSVRAAEMICAAIGLEFDEHKSEIIKALKNLSPYVSYGDQYKAALSVYNVNLAELVAERSEMDPQVYRPFLDRLKSFSEFKRRQKISKFLGNTIDTIMYYFLRYDEGEVTYGKLITYAEKKKCFDIYYHQFIRTGSVPDEIMVNYALQLQSENKFKEAGIVYCSNKRHYEAYLTFMYGLFWEEAISSLYHVDISPAERKQELLKIANQLEMAKRFKDAGFVYHNFCDEHQSAADCYMKGLYFKEAYFIMLTYRLTESFRLVLIPNVELHMKEKFSSLKEYQAQYTATFNRLKTVRETKISVELDEEKTQDYFSEAGSVMTKSTRSTTSQVSKKKSKEEKKYRDTREGSKYEDIAIMRKLYIMIEESCDIMNQLEELASLLNLLTCSNDPFYTTFILNNVNDFKKQMIDTSDEIWPEVLKRFDAKGPEEAAFVNISGLGLRYRSKPAALSKLTFKIIGW